MMTASLMPVTVVTNSYMTRILVWLRRRAPGRPGDPLLASDDSEVPVFQFLLGPPGPGFPGGSHWHGASLSICQ